MIKELQILSFFFSWEMLCMNMGKGEAEKEILSMATSSTEPNEGLDLTTVRSWSDPKSKVICSTDWATQVPQNLSDFN